MIFSDFKTYIYGILNTYNDSIIQMITHETDKLFKLTRSPNRGEIMKIDPNKISVGLNRFYLIRYNYNGNQIWCPIYAMEFRTIKNKNILYALQLEYLPPKYKMNLFSIIFNYGAVKDILDKNSIIDNVMNELPLPIEPKAFYNILKNNGNMNYALTGYDFSKIKTSYRISTKILPEIIMADCKRYNSTDMKDLIEKIQNRDLENKLSIIIEEYNKLIENYEHDSVEYHKKVKNFEKHLKLFED